MSDVISSVSREISVIDPFSRSGDEVAGVTANEIALNLRRCVAISRQYRQPLQRRAPDLRKLFRGHTLSVEAKKALRECESAFASAAKS
jgi:hypothetical protein